MDINTIMKEKDMTKYRLAKESGLSTATITDLCSGKVNIRYCNAETLYKIAKALDVSMESLLEDALERIPFESFKSNVCQRVKHMGDVAFIEYVNENNRIFHYLDKKWYAEAFYLLAMVDYLCRENRLPVFDYYEGLRHLKLDRIIYPYGIILLSEGLNSEEPKEESLKAAIPEFLRHNIVEAEIRDVA